MASKGGDESCCGTKLSVEGAMMALKNRNRLVLIRSVKKQYYYDTINRYCQRYIMK